MSTAEVERAHRYPRFKLHHRLGLALEVEGIGVQEMADYLEVSRESVSRWVNGRGAPKKATLMLWALRTGVDFDWLRTGELPRVDSNHQPADYRYGLVRRLGHVDDAAVIDIATGRRVS